MEEKMMNLRRSSHEEVASWQDSLFLIGLAVLTYRLAERDVCSPSRLRTMKYVMMLEYVCFGVGSGVHIMM